MLGVLEAEVVGDLGHCLAGGGQRDGLMADVEANPEVDIPDLLTRVKETMGK